VSFVVKDRVGLEERGGGKPRLYVFGGEGSEREGKWAVVYEARRGGLNLIPKNRLVTQHKITK
jgi:hypothetical protein